MGEKCSDKFRQRIRLPRNSRDLLHAANLRHGTDGFTSPPKEGVLRIFFALKNPAGFEPANLGTKGQHATSRPPKPVSSKYHTKNFQEAYYAQHYNPSKSTRKLKNTPGICVDYFDGDSQASDVSDNSGTHPYLEICTSRFN